MTAPRSEHPRSARAPIARAIIAGGKTGGHLYPGVAVAEELRARNPAARVLFIGTADGIESRVLPKLGWPLETLSVSRLKGGSLLGRVRGVARIPGAMFQSWRLLRRLHPQVVLGVGGYASGPTVLTAWLCRIPTAIQEQNALPGMTNRILGHVVRAIYLGFGAAGRFFDPRRTVETGNPIRRALAEALASRLASRPTAAAAAAAEDSATAALRVLVFGGSQGARFLNEQVPPVLTALAKAHPDLALTLTHQTGPADLEATRARYAAGPLEDRALVLPYIDDMPSVYARSDLAICRAGALTLAELTAVGLPSLLVPFPFAADNHQEANARVLTRAGAAKLVRQADWRAPEIAAWLIALATAPARLRLMSDAARALARPDAARLLVDHLEGLARPDRTPAEEVLAA